MGEVLQTADFVMTVPAAANGDDSSFRKSSMLTHGHRWQIVGIGMCTGIVSAITVLIFTVLILLVLVTAMLSLALIAGHSETTSSPEALKLGTAIANVVASCLVVAMATSISTCLHATALGCIYRHLNKSAPLS